MTEKHDVTGPTNLEKIPNERRLQLKAGNWGRVIF
jgi:hypothetical protein